MTLPRCNHFMIQRTFYGFSAHTQDQVLLMITMTSSKYVITDITLFVSLFCPCFCCCWDKKWISLITQFQESLHWCGWCPILGHGTRNMWGVFWYYQLTRRCNKAGAMRSWSQHQKYERGFLGSGISWFLTGAMKSWSQHQKYERDSSISLCLFSSLLLNWPVLEICNVLCTSHCVVFIMFPPHGTGPWEGAFNQQERWTNYWWWFQNKWFIEVPKLSTHLVRVTGLPDPVTRIHKYYKLMQL